MPPTWLFSSLRIIFTGTICCRFLVWRNVYIVFASGCGQISGHTDTHRDTESMRVALRGAKLHVPGPLHKHQGMELKKIKYRCLPLPATPSSGLRGVGAVGILVPNRTEPHRMKKSILPESNWTAPNRTGPHSTAQHSTTKMFIRTLRTTYTGRCCWCARCLQAPK